ncbi:hypothetical protein PG991_011957 [Apiospora marii]|uniref:Uncharacterized protein n=2 Tax=Apiospora marii TaxID=335849 RepID=A0ABR1RHQ5_9PEZI
MGYIDGEGQAVNPSDRVEFPDLIALGNAKGLRMANRPGAKKMSMTDAAKAETKKQKLISADEVNAKIATMEDKLRP